MPNAVSRPANDSEMISVRPSGVMTMPLGNWMSPATRRSCPSGATSLMKPGLRRRAGDEVEVRAVDVGVATCVDHDLVRPLLGVDGHRPVRLLAPDLVAGRQQPAAGQA
jgi:hypothetical protein